MSIIDTVKSDLVVAMKAGERDRVGALRLLLSELQKSAKEGSDDELASCAASASGASRPSGRFAKAGATNSPTARPLRR